MEWLEGQSLRDVLQARRLSLDELLPIAIDVADGLDAAHRASVVHRDIKPGNVFVLNRNRAKLLDFGLAKMETPLSLPLDATPLTDNGVTHCNLSGHRSVPRHQTDAVRLGFDRLCTKTRFSSTVGAVYDRPRSRKFLDSGRS